MSTTSSSLDLAAFGISEKVTKSTELESFENDRTDDLEDIACDSLLSLSVSQPTATNTSSMYNLLAKYGSNYAEILVDKFRECRIQLRTLSALNDADLVLLGVEDPEVRQGMIDEFHQLPNQMDHFDSFVQSNDGNGYNQNVLQNIQTHLDNVLLSIEMVLQQLQKKQIENTLFNNRFYTSAYILRLLEEIDRYAYSIDEQLRLLEVNAQLKKDKKAGLVKKRSTIKRALFTGLAVACVGLFIYRYHGKMRHNPLNLMMKRSAFVPYPER